MNLQIQFQMQDIIKKTEAANKKKTTATFFIIAGAVLIFVAIVIAFLGIMAGYGSSSMGQLNQYIGTYACCISVAILLGLIGLVFLIVGIMRRASANQELNAAEEANRLLRMQIGTEDKKQAPTGAP